MTDEKLSEALGLPVPVPTSNNLPAVVDEENEANNDVQNDYKFARDNLYSILTKGTKALEELVEIASQSQHPRAYEVLASLVKNLGETNEKLMDLQQQVQEMEAEAEAESGSRQPIQVANAVFVGTTNELLNMTNKQKKLKKS